MFHKKVTDCKKLNPVCLLCGMLVCFILRCMVQCSKCLGQAACSVGTKRKFNFYPEKSTHWSYTMFRSPPHRSETFTDWLITFFMLCSGIFVYFIICFILFLWLHWPSFPEVVIWSFILSLNNITTCSSSHIGWNANLSTTGWPTMKLLVTISMTFYLLLSVHNVKEQYYSFACFTKCVVPYEIYLLVWLQLSFIHYGDTWAVLHWQTDGLSVTSSDPFHRKIVLKRGRI